MGYSYLELNKELTKSQIQLKHSVREFAQEVLKPAGRALDALSDPAQVAHSGSLFWECMKKMRELDYHKVFIPEAVGGMGLSPIELHIFYEELSVASVGFSIAHAVDMFPAFFGAFTQDPQLIAEFTTPYLDDRDMNYIGCWAITEPAHGSDTLMLDTPYFDDPAIQGGVSATRDGDGWVISGQKSAWVSNGPVATHAALFITSIDGREGSKKGMSNGGIALVPLDLPGISKGTPLDKIGQRDLLQGEIFFDKVRIPQRYMIATPETYPGLLDISLSTANALMAACFTGVARSAFEEALTYAKGRIQGGVPICRHQLIQDKLFKMFMKIEASRALSRAAMVYNYSTQPPSIQYSIAAKVFATQTAFEVASEAVQIFGGNGLTREYPIEKIMRDARASLIEDGTNEILGLAAAHAILKKY